MTNLSLKPAFSNNEDQLAKLPSGSVKLEGYIDERIRLVSANILKALDYSKLADFFRNRVDPFAAGEFWGKIVRAACVTYQYVDDSDLKMILDNTIEDMLLIQTDEGCISTVPDHKQPLGSHGSDLWERKYVLLGLSRYYEITREPKILEAMVKLADYTISQVGFDPKVRIVDTGWAFCGIESSSILEPIMRLYHSTGYQRYLDFAKYIVEEEGACKRENIFEAVLQGKDPKDIGGNGNPSDSIAKAYEMMSCFEGLVEYYRATGKEKWKRAAIIFYEKVCEQEITILGSGGADKPYNLGPGTGEQWNYTAYEQTNPDILKMMETCVTVTWMKLCYQILRMTGDSKVADQIEKSIYNALLGALKADGSYFEYFPRFNGTRSTQINFGQNIGEFPLSCCTANGPAGTALIPSAALMNSGYGAVVNFYIPGNATVKSPGGQDILITVDTEYPKSESAVIQVQPKNPERFSIKLRIPEWSRQTSLKVNDVEFTVISGEYADIDRKWSAGDKIVLVLDMRCKVVKAPRGSNRAGDNFIALVRGPVVLARDRRLDNRINDAVDIEADEDGYIEITPVDSTINALMQFTVPSEFGAFDVVDYASAGTTWDERSEFRTWLPVKLGV